MVHPADVPTMSKEKLRKTDAVDCNKLARELRSGSLEGIYVPKADVLEIRSLIRTRNMIVKDSTRTKNRIKSLLRFHGVDIPEEFTRSSIGRWSNVFWLGFIPSNSQQSMARRLWNCTLNSSCVCVICFFRKHVPSVRYHVRHLLRSRCVF